MKLLEENDKERYKKFLETHDRCNFQQSLEWGNVKTSWKKEVILSEDSEGNIRGSLCVWIRKIPIFGNLMYSARGPVCDIYDENIIQDLVNGDWISWDIMHLLASGQGILCLADTSFCN